MIPASVSSLMSARVRAGPRFGGLSLEGLSLEDHSPGGPLLGGQIARLLSCKATKFLVAPVNFPRGRTEGAAEEDTWRGLKFSARNSTSLMPSRHLRGSAHVQVLATIEFASSTRPFSQVRSKLSLATFAQSSLSPDLVALWACLQVTRSGDARFCDG